MESRSITSGRTMVGRYELGRTLGEGSFAKVKFDRNVETGENVAINILDKEKVSEHKMIGQIKCEIPTMKLIRHPNVIRIYEATRGRLKEDEARKFFLQLINAVDYCHSLENLLLDASGVLKVSDFELSALPQRVQDDGLVHAMCGTPNYVASEACSHIWGCFRYSNKGFDGAKADLWSCGVILFVQMAGCLPFEDSDLLALYKKIFKADFMCPRGSPQVQRNRSDESWTLLPLHKSQLPWSLKMSCLRKGSAEESPNLVLERREDRPWVPVTMNAFEIISTNQGLNLTELVKWETRFTSKCPANVIILKIGEADQIFTFKCPANVIILKIEEAAQPLGYDVKENNYKLKLQGEKTGQKGHLSVDTAVFLTTPASYFPNQIFEVAPSLHVVELLKAGGDTLEFHK
ncbi:hypothetical protein RJ639_038108, partial [Escallonia herrerae]